MKRPIGYVIICHAIFFAQLKPSASPLPPHHEEVDLSETSLFNEHDGSLGSRPHSTQTNVIFNLLILYK